MTRALLVAVVVALVPSTASAEALSFETVISEPEDTGADGAGPGWLGFAFRYALPSGTEPYVVGSVGAGGESAALSYGLGLRQPIRIGPIESLLALGLRQVATDTEPAPPTAGVELGLPLGRAWSLDAVGGYQLVGQSPSSERAPDWFARAQLSFRPDL